MQIDEQVEEHLREAYRGAVAEDQVRMLGAFGSLSAEDGGKALTYGLFVVSYILHDVVEGEDEETPTNEDLEGVAERAAEASAGWADLDQTEILALLRSCAGNEMPSGIPQEDVLRYTAYLGAYLLQSYRADEEEWWDYLDAIWEELQTTPEPTA